MEEIFTSDKKMEEIYINYSNSKHPISTRPYYTKNYYNKKLIEICCFDSFLRGKYKFKRISTNLNCGRVKHDKGPKVRK